MVINKVAFNIPKGPYMIQSPPFAAEAKNMSVLLVEDHAAHVMVAQFYLESFGYHCDIALQGDDALTKAKSQSYAAILMDVRLPDMDGLEVTRQIRAFEAGHNRIRVPIIGMTAHTLLSDRENCMAAGMDDYIPKPVREEVLKAKMHYYIQANFYTMPK